MEEFPFRPPYDVEKVPNAFLASNLTYPDPLDHMKASLKFESLASPLRGNHEFRRHRLSSYEAPVFYPFKEEEHFAGMHGDVKAETLHPDYHSFVPHQGQMDANFELPLSSKFPDYAIDYYRINRSRGPSFNLGPGRKNSEDLFAHGFDLLAYCGRNFEPNEKLMMPEPQDVRMQHDFLDDFRNASLMNHGGLHGNLTSLLETNFLYQGGVENPVGKDANNVQPSQAPQQQPDSHQEPEQYSELEPKSQKKRKANNLQEIKAPSDSTPSNAQLKKSKSENKKASKGEDSESLSLKASKSAIEKPAAKKTPGQKALKAKKGASDSLSVKAEEDRAEKSTEASSINVSPNPKKEDLSSLFQSKSGIMGTFGQFKKPETAQELLGGLSLPAEVEEYINKSKLFNQIKAPISRKIGTLTFEERRIKIEKYLEKRKRRSWNKRVNYDCRKKVADNRLRIKGRFVTKDQAFVMLEALGIYPDPEKITNDEIKSLLTERFGGVTNKKKDIDGEDNGNQSNRRKNIKKEDGNKLDDFEGDQDTSSFGSQDDSPSESYLKD